MTKKITFSVILVLLFVVFTATIGNFYEAAKTPTVGALAVNQLQDSRSAYVESTMGVRVMNMINPDSVAFLLLFLGLAGIWRAELKKAMAGLFILAVLFSAFPTDGNAYYAKTDYAEVVEVLPNQTAFLIPETGANKSDQSSFMSIDYLNANKVAMKRVTIPHVKLSGSSLWADYYVPAARLLIVDRSPSSREWVTDAGRGTTAKDEGFRFESKESINISTGIVISAFVKEEDAAKFVYWFGAKHADTENMTDEQRFSSIVYGRSLHEVIDDNVRRKVQAVLAREFGKLSLVDAAAHKADVITIVEKEVKETFAPMGITVSYVGYAEGLSYDADIQKAINSVFLAQKSAEAKSILMGAVPYETAMVNINFINAQAEAMRSGAGKWNGELNLPSWVVLPSGFMDNVSAMLSPKKVSVPTKN